MWVLHSALEIQKLMKSSSFSQEAHNWVSKKNPLNGYFYTSLRRVVIEGWTQFCGRPEEGLASGLEVWSSFTEEVTLKQALEEPVGQTLEMGNHIPSRGNSMCEDKSVKEPGGGGGRVRNSARGDEAENRTTTEFFWKSRWELARDRQGWPDNIWSLVNIAVLNSG